MRIKLQRSGDLPIRAELFSAERLEQHAKSLAAAVLPKSFVCSSQHPIAWLALWKMTRKTRETRQIKYGTCSQGIWPIREIIRKTHETLGILY